MVQLLLPLIALIVTGLVIASLWLWWSSDTGSAPPVEANPPPAGSIPDAIAEPAADHVMPEAADEVVRILIGPAAGEVVEISGRRYRQLDEIRDPDQRDRVIRALTRLQEFVGADHQARPAIPAARISPPAAAAEGPRPAGRWGRKSDSGRELPPVPAISVAGEIEALLQQRLAQMPDMRARRIHIHQTPEGGVAIEVDGEWFDGVDDVTDPAARALIQAAIKDWEDRATR